MIDEASSAKLIDEALNRLSIPERQRPEVVQRILNVGIVASFRPPPAGARVTPKQIVAALGDIERGLRDISAGLMIIDGARSTVGIKAVRRRESLAIIERAALGAIADAVLSRIEACPVTADQLAASMPKHGPEFAFSNSWRGIFGGAADRIAVLRAIFGEEDFRAPTRDSEEWFVRAIGRLAEIYHDATGKEAKAYSPDGDKKKRDWRPPFSQFIVDLWPTLALPSELKKVPSNRRIADALVAAPLLPAPGTME